jgi:putative alpha-1,2-mannosidase
MVNMRSTIIALLVPAGHTWTASANGLAKRETNLTTFDPLKYVNQLIGSANEGNVFAGATLPYGMTKAVADVDGQNTGGFATDGSNVTGFSSMHDSGTGGNPSLGNFPLFPQYCPEDELNNCNFPIAARATHYVNDSIKASPGFFALTLENGIHAEMTVAQHTALYHFNFPAHDSSKGVALSPLIMLDLTDLWKSRQNASIDIDEFTGRMKGNGTFLPSFGAGYYGLHFCVDLAGAEILDSGVWINNRADTEPKKLFVTRGFNLFYLQGGGFVRFKGPVEGSISARVGMSFISADQACHNAEREIPGPEYDFGGLVSEAEEAWRQKLSPISIETGGVSEAMQTNFWSGIYRTMISPQDYSGENPLWSSSEPYFDSFYWYV